MRNRIERRAWRVRHVNDDPIQWILTCGIVDATRDARRSAATAANSAEHSRQSLGRLYGGLAAAGYRLQYYQLLAQPFYLAAMVLLAASVSLRFFRFGGVQKIVLGGIGAGFLLYVMAKVTGDLSKAGLLGPMTAAGLPPAVGAVTGLIALLYQEDG